MRTAKEERRAAWALLACFSWRGEDFELHESARPSNHKRFAKKCTRRARRRHDRVAEKEVE